LSTLTKVLIVLLTVFSLFLSGIVVTYVANEKSQRDAAKELSLQKQRAVELKVKAERDLETGTQTAKTDKDKLDAQIIALGAQITKLQADLDAAKRENNQLVQQGASMGAAVQAASAGEKEQRALFQSEHQKVQSLETDRINREKELTETSETLLQKVTIIAQLQDTVRQLTQENQDLGTRLNQYLVQYGKIAAQSPTTVAPGSATARPVQPIAAVSPQTKNISLNGQVTAIDAPNRLAEISIGTAAGVRQDMRFHVIRGDQFVADILILEVWPDKAVGKLDLVKPDMQPQAGDKVATNL
jgi:hypothetical protein